MEILGIIPARGGSRGIPGKNLVALAGKPLLFYTCAAALKSRRLTRTILSTDDNAIAAAAQACGVEVPFMRPAELSGDETLLMPVVEHALNLLAHNQNYCPEIVVVLQPTSPLRRAEHIDGAVRLLQETGADSVVSVTAVPHQYSPVSVMLMDDQGRLAPYLAGEGDRILRRQEKPKLYGRNGPAVCAFRTDTFTHYKSFYGPHSVGYLMSKLDSFDIDDGDDLVLCELILRSRKKRNR